jgi:pyruvate dehydrogenase E2 component (dihydrolipoamide acetyltransferase)
MAVEITVPRLGWSMEEGVFLGWLKKDGDAVKAGEPLFTLEGDKAVQEIESTGSGVLRIAPDGPQKGDTVAVGTVLGYLAEAGESVAVERPPAVVTQVVAAAPGRKAVTAGRARTGPAISPRAWRVAKELGIDWHGLRGSGRSGRIRERDVRAAAQAKPAAGRSVPVTPARRVIAERMLASLQATAPVTLTTTADAGNLVNLRQQFKATGAEIIPSYTDFLVKLTANALRAHPLLNARWEGDHIALSEGVHIGIAVDTDAGLLVPVVRGVPGLSLRQLAARSRELVERARNRKLTADELQGGTFTVSNLGPFGIDAFTPIINHPECAILGVGRIRRVAAVDGDRIVPRDELTLSLTFDHRVVDGAPAARFLDAVRKCVENPGPWLME